MAEELTPVCPKEGTLPPASGAVDPNDQCITLAGERGAAPRAGASTVFLVMTGVLPAMRVLEWLGKSLFGLRRPMTLRFSAAGLCLHERLELSGRVLSDVKRWIPRENLARVAREVRYVRLGLYTGMFSLLAGAYLGTRLVLDGASVFGGSPTLMGAGLLLASAGAGVDLFMSTLGDSRRSRCRVVVIPRRGAGFSCRDVDRSSADQALRALDAAR